MSIIDSIKDRFLPSTKKSNSAIIQKIDDVILLAEQRSALTNIEKGPMPNRSGNISRVVKLKSALYSILEAISGKKRGTLIRPQEYDLGTVSAYYRTEAYFTRSVNRQVDNILKEKYRIVGENAKTLKYVKERLRDIMLATNQTLDTVIREQVHQLVLFHNLYMYKRLDVKSSTGRVWKRWDGNNIQPIAGIFVENAENLFVITDKKGNYLGYISSPDTVKYSAAGWPSHYNVYRNDAVEYTLDEMDHVYYNRKRGEIVSMPLIWPILDDIKTLRLIEECSELLAYQFSHGLMHVKVGDDTAVGTEEEVDEVTANVEAMAGNGMIVTTNRVNIDMHGIEGKALKLESLMLYFKNRILAGLDSSGVQMGEGDTVNKSTAGSIDKGSQARIIAIQHILASWWDRLFDQLLMEGGIPYSQITEENRVKLEFAPVDLDQRIAYENHVIQKWTNNLITLDEARNELGLRPLDDTGKESLFFNVVETPKLELQGEQKMQQMASKNALSTNMARPKNQHGISNRPARTKRDEDYTLLGINPIVNVSVRYNNNKRLLEVHRDQLNQLIATLKDEGIDYNMNIGGLFDE